MADNPVKSAYESLSPFERLYVDAIVRGERVDLPDNPSDEFGFALSERQCAAGQRRVLICRPRWMVVMVALCGFVVRVDRIDDRAARQLAKLPSQRVARSVQIAFDQHQGVHAMIGDRGEWTINGPGLGRLILHLFAGDANPFRPERDLKTIIPDKPESAHGVYHPAYNAALEWLNTQFAGLLTGESATGSDAALTDIERRSHADDWRGLPLSAEKIIKE